LYKERKAVSGISLSRPVNLNLLWRIPLSRFIFEKAAPHKNDAGLPAQPIGFRRPTDRQAALRQDAEPPTALSVYEIVGILGCDDREQYIF